MKNESREYVKVWGWKLILLDENIIPLVSLFRDPEDVLEANPDWNFNGRYPNEPRMIFVSSKYGHIGQLDMVRVPYADLY